MPIKSINYLQLNFGFKILLIISLFYSCTPTFIHIKSNKIFNPTLRIYLGEEIPRGWNLDTNENFLIPKSNIDSINKLLISSTIPGEIRFSQTLTLDSGDYFLMAKYNINAERGCFFFRTNDGNGVKISSQESTNLRTLFFIPIKNKKDITVQFGFNQGSIGNALIEEIAILKADYFNKPDKSTTEKIKVLEEELSLSLKQDQLLDQSVDLYAESINIAFLSKDKKESQPLISIYSSDLFNNTSTSYLSTFTNNDDRGAYCKKSSLSLDELIRLYNIPTRQLHWQKDGIGFHQFLEYWNATDNQWKIIDPYYGVRYIDKNGSYLGFEEVEELVRNNNFTSANIKKIAMDSTHYNESEILEGWINSNLAVHILNK